MLRTLTIGKKLILISLAFSVILLAVTAYMLYDMRNGMIEDRKSKLRALVEVALSSVNRFGDLAESGTMTTEDAQKAAISTLAAMNFDGKNYFFIFDENGILKMHPTRADNIGTNMLELKDPQSRANYTGYLEAAKTMPPLEGYTQFLGRRPGSKNNDTPKLFLSAFDKHWHWIVSTGIFIDDVNTIFLKRAGWIIGLVAVGLGLGLFFTLALSRAITRPLNRTVEALEELSAGRYGVEVTPDRGNTEIGRLGRAFVQFREKMKETEALRQSQAEAEKQAEVQRRAELLTIADEFETAVGSVVDSLADEISSTSSTAADLSKSAQASAEVTGRVNDAAASVAENVQTVATAARQLSTSIAEIGRQVHVARDVAQETRSRSTQTEEQVAALADKVNAIGSVIDIINGIAEQTNLLALNATIEAARAGDAGKGFTVVASEVKALANQTTVATEDIRRNIEAVRSATKDAVDAVRSIGTAISSLESATGTIASAVEQQNAATSEIDRNTGITAEETHSITQAIAEVTRSVADTDQSARRVDRHSSTMRDKSAAMQKEVKGFLSRIRSA
jgi:methyl-accepting chemotaxis protein